MQYSDYLKMLDTVRQKTEFVPETAIVLGSGLGGFADGMKTECIVEYKEIPDFPVSTVEGHKGRFIFGYVEDKPVVAMQGRVHYYEGYSMEKVVLPVRLMRLMGAEKLILTNACGGINPEYNAGDLMLISDHIASFVPNPLIGANIDEFGVRFPDMSEIYSERIRKTARNIAKDKGISLKEGVYAQFSGPSYECPAEIRMLRAVGADVVGMSTACEAIAARHCGFEVCGISCIANMACDITKIPLSHKEVQECADKTAPVFRLLINELVKAI